MSYQSGKMGIAECMAMVFMMTFPRIFLTYPARTLMVQGSLAWVSVLISGLIATTVLLVLNRVFRDQSGDLLQVAETYLGRPLKWLIGLLYIAAFWTDSVLLTRQYAENTLLTALPQIDFTFVLLIYGLTITVILYIGIEAVCRSAYLIMPFGLVGLLVVLLALIPYYKIYSLAPWQGKGLGVLFADSLLTSGINLACIAPALLAPVFHNRKTWVTASLLGTSMGAAMKSLAILIFTLVFGIAVGQERVLPFYEMARMVNLGRFFQRVEALFIILWVIGGVTSIAMHIYVGLYLVTRLFRLPAMRPLLPVTVIFICSLAALPTDVIVVLEMEVRLIHTLFFAALHGIPLLLLAAVAWKGKRGRTVCSGQSD